MEWRFHHLILFFLSFNSFSFFSPGILLFREINPDEKKAPSPNCCLAYVLFLFFPPLSFLSYPLSPRVIIQLMQIGEVVECWQQGCAVVLFSPKVLSPFFFPRSLFFLIFLAGKSGVPMHSPTFHPAKNRGVDGRW